ncbi:MAG: DUF3108 domain-containing protein [Pseudomonadales bacterium]|nr:DUF3108 domain-containing protein [Pseudomonadales bacterium]
MKCCINVGVLLLLMFTSSILGSGNDNDTHALVYDARVGFLSAGTLEVNMLLSDGRYEMFGDVRTSGAIERFFRWRGKFAAVGFMVEESPRTRAYLLFEETKSARKVTLAAHGRTTIHRPAGASREVQYPRGSDLMSVLFLTNHCFNSAWVHDGEDAYEVILRTSRQTKVEQGRAYFRGRAEQCRYRFRYGKDEARGLDVWLGLDDDRLVPVRIRVRVPFRPDALLKLRARRS